MKLFFTGFIIFFLFINTSLAALEIKDFDISQSVGRTEKFMIIAKDSLENVNDDINGTYKFSVNGFNEVLHFRNGIAESSLIIDKSIFLYIKHLNETSPSKLYYVLKTGQRLNPISISWYILLAIPAFLIFIGYMFRRIIKLIIVVLIGYFYFTYSKGLSLGTFLESAFDGLRNLF
ncbi:hypothetical protein [Pseudopedobacter beijingensis]|uniref:Uncharacterized protein n=1 Tax=Pseudopedobacter beijingensis TaxID=1207056 RepID=A0ABW4IGT2_9SPHI